MPYTSTPPRSSRLDRVTAFFTSVGGLLTAIAAVLTAVIAAGGYAITRDEDGSSWANEANAICGEFLPDVVDQRQRIRRILNELNAGEIDIATADALRAQEAKLAGDRLVDLAARLRALDVPSGIADDVGQLVSLWDQLAAVWYTIESAYEDTDVWTYREAESTGMTLGSRADEIALSLGARSCVSGE